jgi:choline monooxygenase
VRLEVPASERRHMFWRTWPHIGPAAHVAAPAGYLAADIAGREGIAIRGRIGGPRGFADVCRHRGARLVATGHGTCGVIVGPCHTWSCADTGRLLQAPWFGRDPSIVPDDRPLVPVAAEVWRGPVFASLDHEEGLALRLGGMTVSRIGPLAVDCTVQSRDLFLAATVP